MKDHWTAEEYRVFRETGKLPSRKTKKEYEKFEGTKLWPPLPNAADKDIYGNHPVTAYIEKPSPTCCQSARPSGVTVPDDIPDDAPKKRKYRNEPTWIDGIRFDSKHEAEVYRDLMLLVKAGELKCVCRQTKFDLGGGPHAQRDSRYQYVADFLTIDNDGKVAVYDAKSPITRKNRTYINKKKAMLALWDIEIIEV